MTSKKATSIKDFLTFALTMAGSAAQGVPDLNALTHPSTVCFNVAANQASDLRLPEDWHFHWTDTLQKDDERSDIGEGSVRDAPTATRMCSKIYVSGQWNMTVDGQNCKLSLDLAKPVQVFFDLHGRSQSSTHPAHEDAETASDHAGSTVHAPTLVYDPPSLFEDVTPEWLQSFIDAMISTGADGPAQSTPDLDGVDTVATLTCAPASDPVYTAGTRASASDGRGETGGSDLTVKIQLRLRGQQWGDNGLALDE